MAAAAAESPVSKLSQTALIAWALEHTETLSATGGSRTAFPSCGNVWNEVKRMSVESGEEPVSRELGDGILKTTNLGARETPGTGLDLKALKDGLSFAFPLLQYAATIGPRNPD